MGVYKHPTKNRRIWWNSFWSEWRLSGGVGVSSYYCRCHVSEYTVDIADCNGHWYCYNGGDQQIGASGVNYGDCVAISTIPPAQVCDSEITYSKVWRNVETFRERRDGQAYIDDAVTDFFTDNPQCGGDETTLQYYYDFTFRRRRQRLTLEIVACCGVDGAEFDDSFTPPTGFSAVNTGDAFTGDYEIDIEDGLGTKEIVVFVVTGVLVLICCIAAIYIAKRIYDKRKAASFDGMEMTHINATR